MLAFRPMEPEPSSPPSPPAAWRARWTAVRAHAIAPGSPPRTAGRLALVGYGLAQPFLGLRTIVRSRDLLGIALAPAFGVLLIAGVVAYDAGEERGVWHGLGAFLLTVAALAPLPSLLFGRVYAHLAAKARPHLGLAPVAPYVRGLVKLVGEWVAQVVVLAVGALPYVVLARIVPTLGPLLALGVQGLWAVHWIVVEGYDNARTLPAGHTVAELEARALAQPGHPWFHRWHHRVHGPRWLVTVLKPLHMLSEIMTTLSRPWRIEVDLTEREPWISLGFGLGAAAMLTVPGLNLLFRPAVVVGGVHLRHHLLLDDASLAAAAPGRPGTQPYAVLPPEA
jgi:hypothetical protein